MCIQIASQKRNEKHLCLAVRCVCDRDREICVTWLCEIMKLACRATKSHWRGRLDLSSTYPHPGAKREIV